jgi:hypothetical protein
VSTTVQNIYDQVCFAMLEDGGFTSGVYTEARFLHSLSTVLLDFCQRTGLVKNIFTEMINAGVSLYQVPEDIIEPQTCFVGGRLIERISRTELDSNVFEWPRQWGQPKYWHEDNLDVKFLELVPKPDFNGTNIEGDEPPYGTYDDFFPTQRNLTIVGAAAPDQTTWVLGDTLQIIPDSFTSYLVYGILEDIFGADGETADPQRRLYVKTRYEEGIALAVNLIGEEPEDN